jgi:neutral ceramidase
VAKLALGSTRQTGPDVLRINSTVLNLPVEPLPPLDDLRDLNRQWAAQAENLRSEGASWEQIARVEIQRDWSADALQAWKDGPVRNSLPCEIMAVRLGEALVIAAPLELFTETGLAIRASSPAPVTLICSNSNGALGYLPTLDAYQEEDYTNPQGVAPKVYGLHAFSQEAEPLFRQEVFRLMKALFV